MKRVNELKQQGVTLIEVMIAISILAIILTLGVPSFQNLVANNRITAQTNALVAALNFARNEAVKRSEVVQVCAGACSGTDWTLGWQVVDASDVVLREWDELFGGTTVSTTPAAVAAITYGTRGALQGSGPIEISLQVENCQNQQRREVSVSNTGRVSVNRADCE